MPYILLIDDDQNLHDLFTAYAERLKCDALHASDGEEGENLALAYQPDLIVLDIMMPMRDGYTTCQDLRRQGYHGAISLTSSLHEATGIQKVRECGANGYIMKPLDASVLALHLEYARSGMKFPSVDEWILYQ